jgi:hypothetical protein
VYYFAHRGYQIFIDKEQGFRLDFALRSTESGVGGETRKGLHPKGTVEQLAGGKQAFALYLLCP